VTTKAAVGLLVDNAGRILFARRSPQAHRFPNQWEFPGGALEIGEDFEDGLRRELYEELGVTLREAPQVLRDSSHVDDGAQEWLVRTFICRYSGAPPYVREPDKCSQIAFLRPENPPSPLIEAAQSDLFEYRDTMLGT
jgi:8-oxo-dGTP diphosphatase